MLGGPPGTLSRLMKTLGLFFRKVSFKNRKKQAKQDEGNLSSPYHVRVAVLST